jgi:hypothetical protein
MTAWTAERERRAIVAHVARCRSCQALLSDGQRRQDRELLDAAEALAWEHVENEVERARFAAPGPRAERRTR